MSLLFISSKDPPLPIDSKDPQQIARLVTSFGNATSIALFDPGCQLFEIPQVQGIIGYRFKCGRAIVYEDPVCHPDDLLSLYNAFHQFCTKQGKNIIYTACSQKFAEWSLKNGCQALMEIGQELILDPQISYLEGSKGRKLRSKIHQAENAGVSIYEYVHADPALKKCIEQAASTWLKARKGPQIYLAQVSVFEPIFGKRWFYSQQEEQITGILVLNRLETCQGWFVNLSIVRALNAPL